MIHTIIKTREFEGKSEKEAIEKAIEALALDREAFDVEILVNERKRLFRKGSVKIRIHLHDDALPVTVPTEHWEKGEKPRRPAGPDECLRGPYRA
jgi:predicted RNA-binding protein Jag